MKPETKFLAGAALVATLTMGGFFTCIAQAAPAPRQGQPHAGKLLERLAELGLTQEQKTAVKQVLRQYQPSIEPLVSTLLAERRALQDLIQTGKAEPAAVRAQSAKVAAVAADLAVLRAKIASELRPLLSAEQIQKLQQMQESFRERVDEHRQRVANRLAE